MIESDLRKLGKRLSRGSLFSTPAVDVKRPRGITVYDYVVVEAKKELLNKDLSHPRQTIDHTLEAARALIFARSPWKWDRRIEEHHELLEPLAKTFLERKGVSPESAIATVHVFISDSEPEKLTEVISALDGCLRSFGVETDAVGPPIRGSWYQAAVAVFRTAAKPIKKLKELIEHVQMLESKKATATTKNAIALLEALDKTKSAAILVGPLLILKAKSGNDERIVMKELNPNELQAIAENSVLLQHPEKLMKLLDDAAMSEPPAIPKVTGRKSPKLPATEPPAPPQV